MAQTITTSTGSTIAVIADGSINTTATSLELPGNGVVVDGRRQNDNLVHIAENFAHSAPPANPLNGQLWFDTANERIMVRQGGSWAIPRAALKAPITLTLTGAISGSVSFDGINDATITTTFAPTSVPAGTYTKLRIEGGRAAQVRTLSVGDISAALGYAPLEKNRYLNVTQGNVPVNGMILWGGPLAALPVGFTVCDGKVIQCDDHIIPVPDLRNHFPGGGPGSSARVPFVIRACDGGFDEVTPAPLQEYPLTLSTIVVPYNLLGAFTTQWGAPAGAVRVRLTITEDGLAGSLNPMVAALDVGQFPTGSTIIIDNYGTIVGAGGTRGTSLLPAGDGGDAIKADYTGQTVVVNNFSGASILAGGGGGGAGGLGGDGYYDNCYNVVTLMGQGGCVSQSIHGLETSTASCADSYGAGAYCTGNLFYCGSGTLYYCSSCSKPIETCDRLSTEGGTGGTGGFGQGYQQSLSAGAAGSLGGTNAGIGGLGGSGGGYGQNGATGQAGANGIDGVGSAGSAGGYAGRYLRINGANVIIVNNGVVAGGML